MIAVPWSPIVPETMIRSPGRRPAGESDARASTAPDARRAEVHLVGVAALDDLGVAGDDLARRPTRRRRAIASTSARSTSAGRPSSSTIDRLSASGRAPGDREVVDRAVDRQLADRAAREADRLDHEAVGRERDVDAADRERAGVGERRERGRAEGGDEQALDQRLRGLAAGAVGHRDVLVLEPRALGARGLDDPEDPLLAVGDGARPLRPPPARARSGRSCSRRRRRPRARPCTSRWRARACTRCRRPCTPTA